MYNYIFMNELYIKISLYKAYSPYHNIKLQTSFHRYAVQNGRRGRKKDKSKKVKDEDGSSTLRELRERQIRLSVLQYNQRSFHGWQAIKLYVYYRVHATILLVREPFIKTILLLTLDLFHSRVRENFRQTK